MCIRAAESKGADARQSGAISGGPGFETALDVERQLVKGDVRVRLGEIEAGRDRAVVQRECCFDQAGDTGRGFQVAKVGLDRAKSTASSCARPSARTDPSAAASIGSPRSVPVPCASI